MEIKLTTYKPKGMNKDLSYSIFNPEYSWHNKNIRLTARDSNDLLSVTNERGNLSISFNEISPRLYYYTSTFYGYANTMIPPTYYYTSIFSNYSNTLIPPTFNYQSTFLNYSNTLINI